MLLFLGRQGVNFLKLHRVGSETFRWQSLSITIFALCAQDIK
jgi:hypothetical protein